MAELSAFLTDTHGAYEAHKDTWRRNELRLRGGRRAVEEELRTFSYEDESGKDYQDRLAQAVYVNFPLRMASKLVGALAEKAPQADTGLDFGTLGDYREEGTRARRLWLDCDGQGRGASQWETFWSTAHVRALATGHRWIQVDTPQRSPDQGSPSGADEAQGFRPYLVEHSPLAVPNWYYDESGLQWLVIKSRLRVPRIEEDTYTDAAVTQYALHVRRGYGALDQLAPAGSPPFSRGGAWIFREPAEGSSGGSNSSGSNSGEDYQLVHQTDYDRTGGAIPIVPFFYERDRNDDPDEGEAAFSRPGLTEIGQVASAYLNLGSAGDHDAVEAGSRLLYLLGISPGQHEQVTQQVEEGSKVIGVPRDPVSEQAPGAHDTAAASATESVESRQERKEQEAAFLAADEAAFVPSSSAESKQMGVRASRSPRLALMAEEREEAQSACIRFAEMRWDDATPTGSARWDRDYDLATVMQGLQEVGEVMDTAGVRSPTLAAELVLAAAAEKGLLSDPDQREQVRSEIQDQSERDAQFADAVRSSA